MSKKNKGIMFIVLSSLSFAIMSTFVKLAGDIPSIQKSFFRNIIALIMSLAILIKSSDGFKFNKKNLPTLILRSFFGTVGVLCNYYAIDNLLLSDASMINKLSPFFVIIFSFIILHEKIKIWQGLGVFVAFIGSLFIINPGFLFNLFNLSFEGLFSFISVPALVGLIGALGAGLAYTFVRKLTLKNERGYFIVFFFSTFSCIVTLPYVIFNYTPMSFMQTFYLILSGIFAAFGQFAITAAYRNAPAREISIFDYSQIIFSSLIGFLVFGQTPSKNSIIGYFIICGAALFMFLLDKNYSKANQN